MQAKNPLIALSVLFLSVASGCFSRPDNVERENSTIKPLAVAYGSYISSHRGVPPANEEGFRQHLQNTWENLKNFHQLTSVDDLLISNRDKQPYVILYGDVTGPKGPAGMPVVAYEKTGVNGKRFVASSLGAIEEVDEKRFQELVPQQPAGDPAGS